MSDENQRAEAPRSDDRMQRIRVGLTGLAVVLVLVMLATALVTRIMPEQAVNASVASTGDEPLADLGVAPGAPDNVEVANGTAP